MLVVGHGALESLLVLLSIPAPPLSPMGTILTTEASLAISLATAPVSPLVPLAANLLQEMMGPSHCLLSWQL